MIGCSGFGHLRQAQGPFLPNLLSASSTSVHIVPPFMATMAIKKVKFA